MGDCDFEVFPWLEQLALELKLTFGFEVYFSISKKSSLVPS